MLAQLPPEPEAAESHSASAPRRVQILDAARRCFARQGFHASSMQQICAEAQMSPGGLYRYFPSKDAIIEAIADEERQRAAAIMHLLEGDAPLRRRLLDCGMAFIADSSSRECAHLMIEVSAESLRNGAVAENFHRIDCDAKVILVEALRKAQASGEIAADVDLEAFMFMIMAIGDGIVLRLGLEPQMPLAAIEAMLGRIIDALLAGKSEWSPLAEAGRLPI